MGFRCGIVGLPNVGKSTLFNALTNAQIEAQNYPFCTIEPNVGIVGVPDRRLGVLADLVKPERVLPTTIEFVDIAGLVKGAASGAGLGNRFLAHIREVEAIAQVIRCFDQSDIIHVEGRVDPVEDIAIIDTELLLADLDSVQKSVLKLEKSAKSRDKQSLAEVEALKALEHHLNEGGPARRFLKHHPHYAAETYNVSGTLQRLLTAKPVLWIANVAENGFDNNPYLDVVERLAAQQGATVVPVCAALEAELAALPEAERGAFLSELRLQEPGLNRIIRAGYDALDLLTYFTAGEKEVRAWTVTRGAKAPAAARVIHSDFEKGFIRAEVVSYEDFVQYGGEAQAKEGGRWRLEGKEYEVQDGDIMHFRFSV